MLCAVQHMLSAFLENLRLRRKTHLAPNAQAIAARVVCFSLGLFNIVLLECAVHYSVFSFP